MFFRIFIYAYKKKEKAQWEKVRRNLNILTKKATGITT